MEQEYQKIVEFIRGIFKEPREIIPLHAPVFAGNEKKYLLETIDSTFVSSVGEFVNRFEEMMAQYTEAKYAVACVNGTSALHMALMVGGVEANDEVITQALTFVATANAISYMGAHPVFVDVDRDTMGLSPKSLARFLEQIAEKKADGFTYNKQTCRRIKACAPMHTFGFPCRVDELVTICNQWNIVLIEDAAESIGSIYKNRHTGTFGLMGVFSFNGNKTITCGGGGAIVTNSMELAQRAKHLTTQAKVPHPWRFTHDAVGYNYRMPNLNAALACAQLEQLDGFIAKKRELAKQYENYFNDTPFQLFKEIEGAKANYWLNTVLLNNRQERDDFLEFTNAQGVMTRPTWDLMHTLKAYKNCWHDGLEISHYLAERVVNLPSSVL